MNSFENKVYLKYIKRKLFYFLNIKRYFQKSFFQKYKTYPKTILLTRQDNLGDALISLPFFKSLSEHFNIKIISSSYNNFILEPFFETEILDDLKKDSFSKGDYKKLGKYDVFIELIGKSAILKIATSLKGNFYKYIVGFKLPITAFLADYAYPFSFSYEHKNILEIYYREIEKALNISLTRYDSFDFSPLKDIYGVNEKLKSLSKNILVFFIGVKKYRNLSIKFWESLFQLFIKSNIPFLIIDSKVENVFSNFSREFQVLKNKKYYYYSIKSLDDLFKTYFSIKNAKLIVGIDSGPMHLFSYGINTLTIFTVSANFNIWPPYTKKGYKSLNIDKDILFKYSEKEDKSKKYILAKNLACLKLDTCVDCEERFCKDLDPKKVYKVIINILKSKI